MQSRLNLGLVIQFCYAIFIGVHFFVCLWIWIGTKTFSSDPNLPWLLKQPDLNGSKLYVFVTYWVYTVVTTTGYGDFVGGNTQEYLVSILIEFLGFIVFALLILLVITLAESGFSYE